MFCVPGGALLPVRGVVAAGWPSPAEEELLDLISFDEWLQPNKEASFLVRVVSAALTAEGILPGDVLVVERGRRARVGDIVVAEEEGQTGVRKLTSSARPLTVLGVVTAVVRKYA